MRCNKPLPMYTPQKNQTLYLLLAVVKFLAKPCRLLTVWN
ncbi:Uncharacterised protein [Mycobacteroides abscessus subsp. abscessus]|nr:Uncharacterised protein [Mycobacteroides abscessus subsp. abscessus]